MSCSLRSLFALAMIACGSGTPAPGAPEDCERRCVRSCDAKCSTELAQCEVTCDSQAPMDLGNTEKQQSASRSSDPACRRACSSQEQSCLSTCKAPANCGC